MAASPAAPRGCSPRACHAMVRRSTSCGWLSSSTTLCCLWLAALPCLVSCRGFNVQIMVTTKLASLDRRAILRNMFGSCLRTVGGAHTVEMTFFLGNTSGASSELLASLEQEAAEHQDLVFVGGPDFDPWVPRDATYVLDRPTSRGYRLAYGTAWLADNKPELDYAMYLDDDSYLHIPRLVEELKQHGSRSLAMGFLMETTLDSTKTPICEMCQPCERCLRDKALTDFCGQLPHMSLGGCLTMIQQCSLFNDGDDLGECTVTKYLDVVRVAAYFGSQAAPRWFLGMGWVFGRRIVDFLARNVERIKKRGAADVQLGSWLAPLEDVKWVDVKDGRFHDYPMPGSTFSAACTEQTVLVHRMNAERWKKFNPETCELHCPMSKTGD
eukprot:TRINITY_DN74103_c0_g1_i1.p1 TRINITY_DN74103_c0_g1~~TRINITY_DN74103_c0_g1_i1.p1  ORF type:complete len:383 (+),score=71.98 TRINITY_DN74103_c0_g1_i1:189-1337(+)